MSPLLMSGRLALAGLLIALAWPAMAVPPLETMSASEVDAAACELIRHRDHIQGLARSVGSNPGLSVAQRDYLLTEHADLLRKVANLADMFRQRQRAFPKYDFNCRP